MLFIFLVGRRYLCFVVSEPVEYQTVFFHRMIHVQSALMASLKINFKSFIIQCFLKGNWRLDLPLEDLIEVNTCEKRVLSYLLSVSRPTEPLFGF